MTGAALVGLVSHVGAILCAMHYLRATRVNALIAWVPVIVPFFGRLTPRFAHFLEVAGVVASLVFWHGTDQEAAYPFMVAVLLSVVSL